MTISAIVRPSFLANAVLLHPSSKFVDSLNTSHWMLVNLEPMSWACTLMTAWRACKLRNRRLAQHFEDRPSQNDPPQASDARVASEGMCCKADLLGYVRVSTTEQDATLQLDALRAAGCSRSSLTRPQGPWTAVPSSIGSSISSGQATPSWCGGSTA